MKSTFSFSFVSTWLLALSLLLTACGDGTIFSEDTEHLYAIKKGLYYGFIDSKGNEIIPAQFAYAVNFSEGLAAVNVGGTTGGHDMPTNGKWGFVDKAGNFYINPVYYSPPNGGQAFDPLSLPQVMHDGYRFVDSLAAVRLEDRWVYINRRNQIAIDYARQPGKNGREDKLLPIQSARTFSEGRAAVYVNGGWGYIDKRGTLVIEPKYLYPVDFRSGYAVVSQNTRDRRCIDKQGMQVFAQYRIETNFHQQVASIREGFEGEKTFFSDRYRLGLMNTQGHILVPAQFDDAGYYGAGLCPVRVGSEKSGKPVYADKTASQEFDGGKWGYVDSTGFLFINPVYDYAKGFRNGLAAVRVGNLWGYINERGSYAFPPQFKFAGYFDGPLATVRLSPENQDRYENRLAYINQEGDVVWIEP
jgi:hypothetical protein